MRLVTFSRGKSPPRLGAALGTWDDWEAVVDLAKADRRIPGDMLSFIDSCGSLSGPTWRNAGRAIARAAKRAPTGASAFVYRPGDVRLHAPIAPRLLRDFIAFRGHIARTRAARGSTVPEEWDRLPAYYNGNHLNVVGPGARIPRMRYIWLEGDVRRTSATNQLDYEAEIGFVVGRDGRNVEGDRAARYLFGVTIFNDFSARDVQTVATRIGMGPSPGKDWSNALGPCIVTRDEFGALQSQRVSVRVNGEERLRGTYEDLVYRNPFVGENRRAVWRFEEMLDIVSHSQNVHAGEVWGSGTIPGGCEFEKGDQARYLSAGDTVQIEIEGIGVLRNTIAP
jgi:2-keto-4-pentenoate hydratase/2-oxohepta-3-ene-1,7-dioic acid hydratase in catechol pathway